MLRSAVQCGYECEVLALHKQIPALRKQGSVFACLDECMANSVENLIRVFTQGLQGCICQVTVILGTFTSRVLFISNGIY